MLKLIDYHVHESHSRDTINAKIINYVGEAEKKGIVEIAFTTHLILTGPDVNVGIKISEIQEYINQIFLAQETTKVKLLTGLEIDYFPEEERTIEKIVDE
ncbi:PHP domain-containing protein [Candidatus Bathyarchaeota archaeon]|nr:PHP domain-containing protein [Candidatus Bathyarchaeota archaeon]